MKNYEKSSDLVKDYKGALEKENNNFSRKILEFLKNPTILVAEFINHPYARLENNRGDWFYLWKNTHVSIEGEWVLHEDLINRLGELLEEEKHRIK